MSKVDGVPWRSANAPFDATGFSLVLRDIETLMQRVAQAKNEGERITKAMSSQNGNLGGGPGVEGGGGTPDSRGWNTIPSTVRGDLLVSDGSNLLSRFPLGAAGTVLRSNGTDPEWGNGFGGGALSWTSWSTSVALPSTARLLFVLAVGGGASGGNADTSINQTFWLPVSNGGTGSSQFVVGSMGSAGSAGTAVLAVRSIAGGETLDASLGSGGTGVAANSNGNAGGSTTVSLGGVTFITAPGGAAGLKDGSESGLSGAATVSNCGLWFQVRDASDRADWSFTIAARTRAQTAVRYNPLIQSTAGSGSAGQGLNISSTAAGGAGAVWYATA